MKIDVAQRNTDLIEILNIKNYLYFECEVGKDLNIKDDIFVLNCITDHLSEHFKKNSTLNRKIIYCISSKWIENQIVPSESVIGYYPDIEKYTEVLTRFSIMIEIFDNEREEIDYIFQDEKGYYTSDILQNSLNLFALKYNEANGGEYIFSPNVTLFGAQRNFYFECTYMNNRLCYKMEKGVISPNYWLQKDSFKKENLKDILNKRVCIWKYFYNLAIYSYNSNKYLDFIINSAISIEAFIIIKVKQNNLEQELERSRVEYESKEENNSSFGFFQTTKFLKENNIISSKQCRDFNSVFGQIKNYRNDIFHGKIESPIIVKSMANNAYKSLKELFDEIDNLSSIGSDIINYNQIINAELAIINLIKNNDYKEALTQINEQINKGYSLFNNHLRKVKILLSCGDINGAKDEFILCKQLNPCCVGLDNLINQCFENT